MHLSAHALGCAKIPNFLSLSLSLSLEQEKEEEEQKESNKEECVQGRR